MYVIKSEATSIHEVKNGLGQLRRFDAPITGVVLNQLNVKKAERYGDYGYHGEYEEYAQVDTGHNKRSRKPQTEAASL